MNIDGKEITQTQLDQIVDYYAKRHILLNLPHANLSHANLSHAHLWHAHLSQANLSQANLSHAHLWQANLWQANLSNVIMNWCSHALIGERLYQHFVAPYENILPDKLPFELMLANTISRNLQWCWDDFMRLTKTEPLRTVRENCLTVMRTWVKDGDGASEILRGE